MNRSVCGWLTLLLPLRWQAQPRLAGVLLIVPLLLASCGEQAVPAPSSGQSARAPQQLVEGKAFPAVTLKTLSGGSVPLQSLHGKLLILNVWATWCQPCRREMPSLQRLSQMLDPQRFAVLGLSIDGDELLASEFLISNHVSFDNYFDRNGKLSQQLGVSAYPETFLIAQDGTLVKRILGQQDWNSPGMIKELEAAYQLNRRSGGADAPEK